MGKALRRREGKQSTGFWQRLNRALTEVGIEHFDDDKDWDERVKLPEWQLARLKRRYYAKQGQKTSKS